MFPCSIHIGALVPVGAPLRAFRAPVGTRWSRRRVVCPRRHPASPYSSPRFLRGFAYGSQCYSGGATPKTPRVAPRGGRVLSQAWFCGGSRPLVLCWFSTGSLFVLSRSLFGPLCTCILILGCLGWSGYVAVRSHGWVGWPSWGAGSARDSSGGITSDAGLDGRSLSGSSECIMYAAAAGGNDCGL